MANTETPASTASGETIELGDCTLADMEYQMLDAALTKYMKKKQQKH